MSEVTKFTLSLQKNVMHATVKEAQKMGREANEHIREILTDNAIASGFLPKEQIADIRLYRNLTHEVAQTAKDIVIELGECPRDITLKAIKQCQKRNDWIEGYRRYIGDPDELTTGNPKKQSLNQNIGYWVKKELGASNRKNKNGADQKLKATGEIITNYTALETR